jgi:hypothetical protein
MADKAAIQLAQDIFIRYRHSPYTKWHSKTNYTQNCDFDLYIHHRRAALVYDTREMIYSRRGAQSEEKSVAINYELYYINRELCHVRCESRHVEFKINKFVL